MPTAKITKRDYLAASAELTPDGMDEYTAYRARGDSHNFAMMFVTNQAPGQVCTDERWAGDNDGKGKYQHGFVSAPYKGKSDAEIRAGKGDPEAYVSSRAQAEERANKLGLVVTGNAPRGIRTVSSKPLPEPKTTARDELRADPKFRAGVEGMMRAAANE